jgi:hypothetical protein
VILSPECASTFFFLAVFRPGPCYRDWSNLRTATGVLHSEFTVVTDILDVVHFVASNPLQTFVGGICLLEMERPEGRTCCGVLFIGKLCSAIYINIDLN